MPGACHPGKVRGIARQELVPQDRKGDRLLRLGGNPQIVRENHRQAAESFPQ